jgi:hypothetical protein
MKHQKENSTENKPHKEWVENSANNTWYMSHVNYTPWSQFSHEIFRRVASWANISRYVSALECVDPLCLPGHHKRTCERCGRWDHFPDWTFAAINRRLSHRDSVKLGISAILRTSFEGTWSFQEIWSTERRSLIKADSTLFSSDLVRVHVSAAYEKIGRTMALKSRILALVLRSACQRGRSFPIMPQASPLRRKKSSSLLGRIAPRYRKLLHDWMAPSLVEKGMEDALWREIDFVLSVFIERPRSLQAASMWCKEQRLLGLLSVLLDRPPHQYRAPMTFIFLWCFLLN